MQAVVKNANWMLLFRSICDEKIFKNICFILQIKQEDILTNNHILIQMKILEKLHQNI